MSLSILKKFLILGWNLTLWKMLKISTKHLQKKKALGFVHVLATDNTKNEESNPLNRKSRRRCSSSRTNCMASLTTSKARKRHRWAIIGFNNVHNHGMVSPKSVKYLRCHKKMSGAAKSLVETFDKEGMPTGKVAAVINNEGSTFSNIDCWNRLRYVLFSFSCIT
jgi:hypothetical protein